MILLDSLVVAKPLLKLQNVNVVMDSLATAKQVLNLQTEVKELCDAIVALKPSTFKETVTILVPVLAIISGFLIGWFVPSRTFKKNIEAENKKKEELEKKEYKLLMMSVFGQLGETSQGLVIELGNLNTHLINANYLLKVAELKTNEIEKREILDRRTRQENRYYDSGNKAADLTKKITSIVNQYFFINPKSDIIKYLKEFKKHNYEVAPVQSFTKEMPKDKLDETRKAQITTAKETTKNTITSALFKLTECIRLENLPPEVEKEYIAEMEKEKNAELEKLEENTAVEKLEENGAPDVE